MSIEAMKQALEFIEWFAGDDHSIRSKHKAPVIADALRQAIAEEALNRMAENARELGLNYEPEQEPVAWMYWQSTLNDDGTQTSPWVHRLSKFKPMESIINKDIVPLYTSPPQCQPLTDEQIQKCYETTGHYQTLRPQDRFAVFALARAIEAAHGIKE